MDILTVILSFMMLLVTGVYVYYTRQLVKESIKMREANTYPLINFKLIPKTGYSKVFIENIGKTPAFNLQIEFEEKIFDAINSDCSKTNKSTLSYFGVGQYLEIPIHTHKFMELNDDININVSFEAIDKHKFSQSVKLNFEAAKDFGIHFPKATYEDHFNKLSDKLEKIGENIKKLTQKNDNTIDMLTAEDIDALIAQHQDDRSAKANPT